MAINFDNKILLIVAVILLAAGLTAATWSAVPFERTKIRTIIGSEPDIVLPSTWEGHPGYKLWNLVTFSAWFGGRFSGSLTVDIDCNLVEWALFDQQNFNFMKANGYLNPNDDHLFFQRANFTYTGIHLPTSGRYYLVLEYEQLTPETFTAILHFRMTGLKLPCFVPGIASAWAGCPILLLANKRRKISV
jgi:hypothetical protein